VASGRALTTMDDTMQRRVCSFGFRVFLAILALACAAPALAEFPTTITISDTRGNVDELLRTGQQLEQQRRWGEALAHYEEAIHRYPNDALLQQRFDSARVHYDLERRYTDRSFCELVLRLSTERAPWASRPSLIGTFPDAIQRLSTPSDARCALWSIRG
jgi:tetratricopeptide (TPR) repeat protein